MDGWKRKFEDLKRAQERENEILRDLLLYNEFSKLAKINELSGKTTFTDTEEIKQLQESLKKAKAELAFIRKNSPTTSGFQQTKTMKLINEITDQIRKVEFERTTSICKGLNEIEEGEYLTEDALKAKIEYELVTSKIEKNMSELESFTKLNQPVLLQ